MPSLVFAIFLAAMVGQSAVNVVLILSLVYWTRYARVVRGEVLSLRERDFVKLAVVTGASSLRIMVRHILPNVLNTTLVLATLMLGVVYRHRGLAVVPRCWCAAPLSGLGPDAGGRQAADDDW